MLIPLGFRFAPTHEEVITYYLLPTAMGLPTPCNHHVLEKSLYGKNADPTHVFRDVDESHWVVSEGNDRVIYVLTKLSKVNNGKTRISRRAGCGTWSGQTGGKRIKNGSGEVIGSMKMFGFEATGKSDDHHWIMHEYSLAGIYSDRNCRGLKHKDYVICKIRRTSKRKGDIREDVDVVAPSFKKLKAATISNCQEEGKESNACLSIQEYVPVLTADRPEECRDRVAMISNYQEEEDCLTNSDDYFPCSTGSSIEEYMPILTVDRREESNNRIGGVSEGGNEQPLADSVFDQIILDDDCACPATGLDFSLDDLEFNLDGLDLFMGSLI